MVDYLTDLDTNKIGSALADLACVYRTLVELTEYYGGMDSFAEWERLCVLRE